MKPGHATGTSTGKSYIEGSGTRGDMEKTTSRGFLCDEEKELTNRDPHHNIRVVTIGNPRDGGTNEEFRQMLITFIEEIILEK